MSLLALLQQLESFPNEMLGEFDADKAQSPDVLALLLTAARGCRADLATLEHTIEAELIATAGEKRFVVDGLGEVQIRKDTKRSKWDHAALTRLLVAMAADERMLNETTGEYERESDAVARVLAECAGISYWRVTPLRARNIQVDEYCSEEHNGFKVQLPPREAK